MSDDFIPAHLIPHGVNDERSRTMIKIASDQFDGFDNHDLLFLDALTVDAEFLPAMAVARTMTDFILPGMREVHVRALLDDYRAIHAQTGYISGVRRALSAIDISVSWIQWFDQKPQGHPNTHQVTAFIGDPIFEADSGPLSAENQAIAVQFINLTKRWSQDIDFRLGVGWRVGVYTGAILRDHGSRFEQAEANLPPPSAALCVGSAGKIIGYMCLTAEAA